MEVKRQEVVILRRKQREVACSEYEKEVNRGSNKYEEVKRGSSFCSMRGR